MNDLRQHPPVADSATCLAGCSCGKEHPKPSVTLCYGEDSFRIMAEDIATAFPDVEILLISDPETDKAAGKRLRSELASCGVRIEHKLLGSNPHATDMLAVEIDTICRGKGLVVSVGSGTVNDLGKYSASRLNLPFWTMPTAPSMNGYTSGIAAIQVKGVKRTLPAAPPERIYAVPSVVRNAPIKLLQAGFCDVLAKVVSDIDWQCESMLVSDSYCRLPSAMMAKIESSYADCPEEIGRGKENAVNGLFHGLLISGVAMSLAGSSAPASGGEHLLSHFLDMRESINGRIPELHGLQVGLGILLSTACYNRLSGVRKEDLTPSAMPALEKTAEKIPEIWADLAEEVTAQFLGKKEALLSFDNLVPAHWTELQKLFSSVRPPAYYARLFSRVGTPFTLAAFKLSREEFTLAARNCRAIRNRITVLDFAVHAGVLDDAIDDVLRLIC